MHAGAVALRPQLCGFMAILTTRLGQKLKRSRTIKALPLSASAEALVQLAGVPFSRSVRVDALTIAVLTKILDAKAFVRMRGNLYTPQPFDDHLTLAVLAGFAQSTDESAAFGMIAPSELSRFALVSVPFANRSTEKVSILEFLPHIREEMLAPLNSTTPLASLENRTARPDNKAASKSGFFSRLFGGK
jgi:hypothetical protein